MLNCAVVSSCIWIKSNGHDSIQTLRRGCWIHHWMHHEWQRGSEDPSKGEGGKENSCSFRTRVSARLWQCFSQQVEDFTCLGKGPDWDWFLQRIPGGDVRRPAFGEMCALNSVSPPWDMAKLASWLKQHWIWWTGLGAWPDSLELTVGQEAWLVLDATR